MPQIRARDDEGGSGDDVQRPSTVLPVVARGDGGRDVEPRPVFQCRRQDDAAVNLDPTRQLSFKRIPEIFAELTERKAIIPAPYAARHMWVQEEKLGAALERSRDADPRGVRAGGGDSPQKAHTRSFAVVEVTSTSRGRSREKIRELAWPSRCSLRGHGSC